MSKSYISHADSPVLITIKSVHQQLQVVATHEALHFVQELS